MARPLLGCLEFDIDTDRRKNADRRLFDHATGLLIELQAAYVLSACHILYVDVRDQLPTGEEPALVNAKVESEEEGQTVALVVVGEVERADRESRLCRPFSRRDIRRRRQALR